MDLIKGEMKPRKWNWKKLMFRALAVSTSTCLPIILHYYSWLISQTGAQLTYRALTEANKEISCASPPDFSSTVITIRTSLPSSTSPFSIQELNTDGSIFPPQRGTATLRMEWKYDSWACEGEVFHVSNRIIISLSFSIEQLDYELDISIVW